METTAPEKKESSPKRSSLWRQRSVGLDQATDAMLLELSEGQTPSAYLRRLITLEYGKMLGRVESEQK